MVDHDSRLVQLYYCCRLGVITASIMEDDGLFAAPFPSFIKRKGETKQLYKWAVERRSC